MTDDDRIIVTGGDLGTEGLAPCRFKVLLTGNKDICGGVKPQELRCPLLSQVVRNSDQRLAAQAKPLGLHSCCNHFKGFAAANFMGKKRVAAVQNVGDGVPLMLPEGDFGAHTTEGDMASVILTGTGGVEQFIVEGNKGLSAFRVFPEPVRKGILDGLLLLLGKGGFLLVQHTPFLTIGILHGVVDTHITQIQRIFQNVISVHPGSTVGGVCVHIPVANIVLAGDVPLCGKGREIDLDGSAHIVRRIQQILHELLDVLLVNPCCAKADINFLRFQVFRLCSFQRNHIVTVQFRGGFGGFSRLCELFTDIAR